MGLPVTVEIGDASEEESEVQTSALPALARARAMTPPARRARGRLDGSSVLTPAQRASVAAAVAAREAVAAPAARRARPARKPTAMWLVAWRSGLKFLGRLRSLILWSSLAYVCLYGSANALLSPLGRVMNSTAHVSESAANTLASILDGGTQLVTVSTNVVKAASVSTLSVAHAAWDGVDLVGLNATRVAGRVLGHRAADIEEWLFSAPGREVLHDPAEEALRFWQNLLVSQTFALPVVSADTQALQAAGEYWTASGTVAFSAAGMVVFEFQALRLTFAPRWANPVWHLAGWDVTSEFAQTQHIACEFAAVNRHLGPSHPCRCVCSFGPGHRLWLSASEELFAGALAPFLSAARDFRGRGTVQGDGAVFRGSTSLVHHVGRAPRASPAAAGTRLAWCWQGVSKTLPSFGRVTGPGLWNDCFLLQAGLWFLGEAPRQGIQVGIWEYELSGCSYRPFVETGGSGSRESEYSMAILVCIAYFGFQKPFPAKRLLSLARSLELDVCT